MARSASRPREELIRFIKSVTSKGQRAAVEVLDQVTIGVEAAIEQAVQYGKEHADARRFSERLVGAMTRGMERIKG